MTKMLPTLLDMDHCDFVEGMQTVDYINRTMMIHGEAENSSAAEQQTDKGMLPIVLSELEIPLGKALSAVLEVEMKTAFGQLWDEVILCKPPWTLSDLLECFMKHWIAVFGMIIPRNMLSCVEQIYNTFCKGKINDDSVTTLLLKIASLLSAFSTRSNYGGALEEAHAVVNKLLQAVSEKSCRKDGQSDTPVSSGRMTPKSTVTETPQKSLASLSTYGATDSQVYKDPKHQEIWALFENVWSTLQNYSTAVFTTFSNGQATDVTAQTMQPPDAFSCLQKLMDAVRILQSGIQSILSPNCPLESIGSLYNFLNQEMNVADRFTAQELYECLTVEEYRKKLTVGSGQLAELLYSIECCYLSVLPEAKQRCWV
ncbi:transcriptional protein SWT1-like [Protopterus annectens]|uniref:transcriptional protein SWT1-like n=1 Tax=Protopterus annectens TaxID=7888 RepID=UPI001CFA2D84|nr:transcriptional protein SWT1-like [Protopterus annectens]